MTKANAKKKERKPIMAFALVHKILGVPLLFGTWEEADECRRSPQFSWPPRPEDYDIIKLVEERKP
jgi:hypothetical protein